MSFEFGLVRIASELMTHNSELRYNEVESALTIAAGIYLDPAAQEPPIGISRKLCRG